MTISHILNKIALLICFKHTSLMGFVCCFFFLEGKKHDAGMLADSGLLNLLQRHAVSPFSQPMCIYGDPAYPLRLYLQTPFRNAVLTPDIQAFNASMSAVRVSVECLFVDIVNYFKFVDFKKKFEIGLSNVGKICIVCALFAECINLSLWQSYFRVF